MAFKLLSLCALVAVARAGVISSPALALAAAPVAPITKSVIAAPAPVAYAVAPVAKAVVADEFDPHPQYSYSYGISDALTGDSKSQQESRDGDLVRGSYSVIDPDGTKRTVEYTADAHSGFNAVVHREQVGVKAVETAPVIAAKTVAVQPVIAKTVVAQPVIAPLATKTIVSKPAVATFAAPALYHH